MESEEPQDVLALLKESLITLEAARRRFPTRPCIDSVRRWCKIGYRGIVLESVLVGVYRCTSTEAITRFLTRINTEANYGGHRRPKPELDARDCGKPYIDGEPSPTV